MWLETSRSRLFLRFRELLLVGIFLFTNPVLSQQEISTSETGGGQAHNNMQPHLTINWAIATDSSVFDADPTQSNRFLGEVRAFVISPNNLNGSPRPDGFIPGGWTLADGRLLDVGTNQALFSIFGTTYGGDGTNNFAIPDLRGRTPRGVGDGPGLTPVALGEVFGEEVVTLTNDQMPVHAHEVDVTETPSAGGGMPHNNQMPSIGLRCLIATQGTFPSSSKPGATVLQSPQSAQQRLFSEMRWYAGTSTTLDPWAECDGALLPIFQNQALFSLIGTAYGGDGETTFALPDARGRLLIHQGNSPQLASYRIGQRDGSLQSTLTSANLFPHTHSILAGATMGDTGSVGQGIAHNNLQPFLVINFQMLLFGGFPDITAQGGFLAQDNELIGELTLFALNFAPRSYAELNGQLLAISQNTALFSLLFNEFGGDAMSTFGLPDARGRVLLGMGQGTGLTNRDFAESGGEENHTLTTEEMPKHRHGTEPLDSSLCIVIPVTGGGVVTPCL